MQDLIGKTVTLPKGVVTTVVGPSAHDCIVTCRDDDGTERLVLLRVVVDLPVTHRRAELTRQRGATCP